MTDKKPRGRPKVENAKTPTERKRASRAAKREAARPAYIAWVEASLARCQSALAKEELKDPRSRFIPVFKKRVAALMAVLSLQPQSSVTITPRRGRTG